VRDLLLPWCVRRCTFASPGSAMHKCRHNTNADLTRSIAKELSQRRGVCFSENNDTVPYGKPSLLRNRISDYSSGCGCVWLRRSGRNRYGRREALVLGRHHYLCHHTRGRDCAPLARGVRAIAQLLRGVTQPCGSLTAWRFWLKFHRHAFLHRASPEGARIYCYSTVAQPTLPKHRTARSRNARRPEPRQ
jgi:hypothetical protein